MKAVIMAAGRGTRISRSINDRCKCMLDIGGVPLIYHTVRMLLNHGIEVHIVVGYNKNEIIDGLKGLPVQFYENPFYSVTNSIVSLWFAKDALCGESVILGNADVFWEHNLLEVLLQDKRDCVMLCDSSRVEQGDYLFKVTDEKVTAFGKGMDCKNANAEYVGLAVLRGQMISKVKTRLDIFIEKQYCGYWWEQIIYSMINERPVWAKDIAGMFWAEIDYIEDYNRILKYKECENG